MPIMEVPNATSRRASHLSTSRSSQSILGEPCPFLCQEPPFAHARLESVAELIKEGQSRCLVLQAVGDSP